MPERAEEGKMEKHYWLFGPGDKIVPESEAGPEVRGEEIALLTEAEKNYLQTVPAKYRWEAVQGVGWKPSPEYKQYLKVCGYPTP